ncbi:BspA family leucine-rich repeat surface protein [Mycoplasma yeatsii]|uniref:BspA family leucine-rich repeat surface protein n=1 Tax=Mycoplasma yeatsii TaxID=51365 RepID=UPI0005B24B43|nr:BspA family leucine-rich repeat surface protein [Mycoplasma yeatsii]AJM71710.1 PARCEL domain-containing protein [Mycoplasma yeatsii GM274B]
MKKFIIPFKNKLLIASGSLILLGGGTAGTTVAVVNKISKDKQEEMFNSIWKENFSNKLIDKIYHKNLINQLNKELKQHKLSTVSLVDSSLLDTTLEGKTNIKVLRNNKEVELELGTFLSNNKSAEFIEDQTICTDIGWQVGNINNVLNNTKEFLIAPNVMPKTVRKVPKKLPWFINALFTTFKDNENEKIEGIQNWDTSNIVNMFYVFQDAKKFNQNINHWNTSNSMILQGVFWNAESFNQPLNDWDVSKVINLNLLFSGAKRFNQHLDKWDTSNAIQMISTFKNTEDFNGNITTWNLDKAEVIQDMFNGAKSFNQDISTRELTRPDGSKYKAWDTSNISSMIGVFENASSFEHDISNWNVNKVNESYKVTRDERGNITSSTPTFSRFGDGSKLTPEKMPKFIEPK